MFVSLLPRQTDQRPVLGASELQRQLPLRQGAEGEVPESNNASRRVPTEQVGVVRHAWQRVAMDLFAGRRGAGATGQLLFQRRLVLLRGIPQLGRAGLPGPPRRLSACPSSRPVDVISKRGLEP